MHWTPEQIVNVITATGSLVTSAGVIVLAYFQYRMKMRLRENTEAITDNGAKIDMATAKVDITSAKVDQVHTCLEDARNDTMTGIEEVKTQAATIAASVKGTQ